MIVLCLSSPLRQWKVVGRDKLVDICVSLVVCIMWTRDKAHTYTHTHTQSTGQLKLFVIKACNVLLQKIFKFVNS